MVKISLSLIGDGGFFWRIRPSDFASCWSFSLEKKNLDIKNQKREKWFLTGILIITKKSKQTSYHDLFPLHLIFWTIFEYCNITTRLVCLKWTLAALCWCCSGTRLHHYRLLCFTLVTPLMLINAHYQCKNSTNALHLKDAVIFFFFMFRRTHFQIFRWTGPIILMQQFWQHSLYKHEWICCQQLSYCRCPYKLDFDRFLAFYHNSGGNPTSRDNIEIWSHPYHGRFFSNDRGFVDVYWWTIMMSSWMAKNKQI